MPNKQPEFSFNDLHIINSVSSDDLIDQFFEFRSNNRVRLSPRDKKKYAKQLIASVTKNNYDHCCLQVRPNSSENTIIYVSIRKTNKQLPAGKSKSLLSRFAILLKRNEFFLLNPRKKNDDLIDSLVKIYGPRDLILSEEDKQKLLAQFFNKHKNIGRFETRGFYCLDSLENTPRKILVQLRKMAYKIPCNPDGKNAGEHRYHFHSSRKNCESGGQGDTFSDEVFGHIEDKKFKPRTETRNGKHGRRFKEIEIQSKNAGKPTLSDGRPVINEVKYGKTLGLHTKEPIFYKKRNQRNGTSRIYGLFTMRDLSDHITVDQLITQIAERKIKLNNTQYHIIMLSIILAVREAHQLGIIHRDLKPDNVMININNLINFNTGDINPAQLIDFGYSCEKNNQAGCIGVGTPGYIAPEVIDNKISFLNDVYSTGVLLWSLLGGDSIPVKHIVIKKQKEMLNKKYQESLKKRESFSFPELTSATELQKKLQKRLKPILQKMTQGRAHNRCQLSHAKLYLMNELVSPITDLLKKNEYYFFYTKPQEVSKVHQGIIKNLCEEMYSLIPGKKPQFQQNSLKKFNTRMVASVTSRIAAAPAPGFLITSSARKKHRRRIALSITKDILKLQKAFISSDEKHQAFIIELISSSEFMNLQRYADKLRCESYTLLKQSGRKKSEDINAILEDLLQLNSWSEVASRLANKELAQKVQSLSKNRTLLSGCYSTTTSVTSHSLLDELTKKAQTLSSNTSCSNTNHHSIASVAQP